MGWANIDDGFHAHPKVVDLLLTEDVNAWAALGVWGLALSWAYRYTIDKPEPEQGVIPLKQIRAWDRMHPGALDAAEALARAHLWDVLPEGTYRIHNFRHWARLDQRAKAQASGRKGAARRWGNQDTLFDDPIGVGNGNPNGVKDGNPIPDANGVAIGCANGSPMTSTPHPLHSTSTSKEEPLARFDEFYWAYPKHKGKGAAETAWARAVRSADPSVIISAAHEVTAEVEAGRIKLQFVPYPAKWLNQKQWLDDPDPTTSDERAVFE